MVISRGMLKNVDFLRGRMEDINRKYKVAFRVGFWVPLAIFSLEVFYYACKLILLSSIYMHELFLIFDAPDEKQVFSPDMIIFVMPAVYSAFSFVSFKMRMRVMKYALAAVDAGFFGLCVFMLVNGYDRWYLYVGGMLYSVAIFIVCVVCIKADLDEALLSKIEGYPHFNPILIHEEIPTESEIRFPDKKSYDELYGERMEEFAADHPESQMARIYLEEKAAKQDAAIDSWFDDMFTKKEKN